MKENLIQKSEIATNTLFSAVDLYPLTAFLQSLTDIDDLGVCPSLKGVVGAIMTGFSYSSGFFGVIFHGEKILIISSIGISSRFINECNRLV